MAGSYSHVHNGWLIDHMGDAKEAVEEMMWLIYRAIGHEEATRLLKEEYYPMCRNEIEKDNAFIEAETRFMEDE